MADATAANLAIRFSADTSALDHGLSKVKGGIGGLVDGLGKIGLAGMGIGAVTGAVSAAGDAIGDLVSKAEGLADSQARVDLVFKGSADTVTKWASTNAVAFGMSKQSALDAAGGLGQYLTNLGLTDQASASMSTSSVELAAKLAAFTGKSTEEAMNAIQKGLGGATRGLKEMGVSIDTSLLKGLDKAGQAQAIYKQLLEQTANAQTAWADNSGDVDVSMQRVSAAVENVQAALGDKLLPVIAPLASAFADALPGALDAASQALDALQPVFDFLVSAIKDGAALIGSVIQTLAQAWDEDWGGIRTTVTEVVGAVGNIMATLGPIVDDVWNNQVRPAIQTFVDWWSANVAPTISAVATAIGAVMGSIAGFMATHWGEIQAVAAGAMSYIQGVIQVGFSIISGVVTAAMALLRGDFSGAWTAIQTMAAGAVQGVQKILMGLGGMIGGIAKLVLTQAGAIGKNIADGIKNALQGAWDGLVAKLKALVDLLPAIVKQMLGIASPSKVFEQIGMYIAMGLAAGLDKFDVKAIESMQKIVASITGVVSNIPNFLDNLKKLVIPSDSDLTDMRAKFEKIVDIMEHFVKSMALRSVAIGVGDSSMIPQNIVDSIKAAGLDPGQLISGGDVGNVGGMMDILSKVASAWKGIADSLTAISAIKIPETAKLDAVKAAAWELVKFAESVARDMPAVPEFGAVADLLSDTVKGVQAVVKLDLSEFKPVDMAAFRGILNQVYSMALELKKLADDLTATLPTEEKARATYEAMQANIKSFFGGLSDIAKGVSDVADLGSRLAEIKAMTFNSLGHLEQIAAMIGDIGYRLAQKILAAPVQATHDAYANLKEYFAAVSEIAKTLGDVADLGAKLKDATAVNVDRLAIAAENARLAFEQGDLLSKAFQGLKDQGQVIADAVKNWTSAAGDSVKLLVDAAGLGEKTKDATAAIYGNLVTAASNAADALQVVQLFTGDWEKLADQGKTLTEAVKNWTASAGAAVDLLMKAAGFGEAMKGATMASSVRLRFVRTNIEDAVDALQTIITDLTSKGFTEELVTAMAKWTDGLGKTVDLFAKAGGITLDWTKVSTISSVRLGFIRANIAEIATQMKTLYEDLTGKGFGTELMTAVGAWAAAVAGIVASFGSAAESLGKVADAKGGTFSQDMVNKAVENIKGIITAFSGAGISKEAADAARAVAEAAGPALDVLGKALDVFSPDKMKGGFFGRTSRSSVMTNAAKTWAQNYANTVSAGIQLMLTTLADSLAGIKGPDKATADAIDAMVKAYSPLIDLIEKMSKLNIDMRKFETVIKAATMLRDAMGGGGAADTGTGGGGAPGGKGAKPFGTTYIYNQYGNNVVIPKGDNPKAMIDALMQAGWGTT